MLEIKKILNQNLTKFWTDKNYYPLPFVRYRVLYGGRASSKSHEICTMLVIQSILSKKRILCTRAFQNKISDSVKALLEEKISVNRLERYFIVTKNSIKCINGSEFLFYGLARNTAEIKGLEGVDICYVEEAQYITKDMFNLLAPTIRKEGSELWIAFNPLNYYDFIYQNFVIYQKDNSMVQKINYYDNPFLSQTMIDEIESFKDDDDFAHVYLGEPKDDSTNSIIKLKWLLECVDAFEKLGISKREVNRVGYDVADAGDDTNAIAVLERGEIISLEEWNAKEDELDVSTQRAVKATLKLHRGMLIYDSIGVGAGVGAIIKNLDKKPFRYYKFVASNSPDNPTSKYAYLGTATELTNKEAFENLKAQQWQLFADRAKATYNAIVKGKEINKSDIISFSSKIPKKLLDKAFQELSTPIRENAEDGKMKVESKKSLKKRGVDSPNLADAIIMANYNKRLSF